MTVKISSSARETMLALAAADPVKEVCGLLLGSENYIDSAMPTKNIALCPELSFEIDPCALIDALRAERSGGPQLLGYFHSHPNGLTSPSATDLAMAAPDNRIWLIIASENITAWRATSSGFVHIIMN